MSLAAETDAALKKRDDPEARAELIKRGLAFDPPKRRGQVARAERQQERKFVR